MCVLVCGHLPHARLTPLSPQITEKSMRVVWLNIEQWPTVRVREWERGRSSSPVGLAIAQAKHYDRKVGCHPHAVSTRL